MSQKYFDKVKKQASSKRDRMRFIVLFATRAIVQYVSYRGSLRVCLLFAMEKAGNDKFR